MAGPRGKRRKDANDGRPYEPSADERIFKAYEDLPPALRELAMIANDRADLLQFEGEMNHPEEK